MILSNSEILSQRIYGIDLTFLFEISAHRRALNECVPLWITSLFSRRNQEQLSETFRHSLLHDHFQGRSFLYHRKNTNRLGTYTAEIYVII